MAIYYALMSEKYYEAALRFKVNPESCDNPAHYETYIYQTAISDKSKGLGTTYIFVDEETEDILGYITLKASALIKDIDGKPNGYPAIEISEPAVSGKYERRGLGTDMVNFAIGIARKLNEESLGIQYLLLCSDPKSVGFYEKMKLGMVNERYEEIPREDWNKECKAMYIKLFC